METDIEEKVCVDVQSVKVQPSNWRPFTDDLNIDIGFTSRREIRGAFWRLTLFSDAACYQKEIQTVTSELGDIASGSSSISLVLPGIDLSTTKEKALWGTGYLVIKLVEKLGQKRKAEEEQEEQQPLPPQPKQEFENLIENFSIKGTETNEEDRGQVTLIVNIRCKDKIWYRNIYNNSF